MKKVLLFLLFIVSVSFIYSQEALKSIEEDYYNKLSLEGLVERPTLGYRTLSDSVWNLDETTEHIWQNNNLGTTKVLWEADNQNSNWFSDGFYHGVKYRLYGPKWYNSYNTEIPYGQNDGVLWQGKGYNTSLTAGARLEAFGFELTLKPEIAWMQNKEYEYKTPNYQKLLYKNKADTYGYFGVRSIDAPQRFGDSSFFSYSLGDSELRYTFHTFTVGFGTQSPWLGPAHLNPIIHSNNATPYPKVDFGFRKTDIIVPYFDWYLGQFEFRGWWGQLTESDYFDVIDTNNKNLISGLSLNYSFPGIFEGLSVGFNRTLTAKWDNISQYTLFRIYAPKMNGDKDGSDQRFSLTFDYLIPATGIDIYLEWARNDFSPDMDFILRYPFHTEAWTFGIDKLFTINPNNKLKVLLELTYLECSADYDRLINWYSTFYSHSEVTQGYTNRGQWLGAGIGTGGNSQYLGFEYIHNKGAVTLFAQRQNPDLDYTMYIDAHNDAENIKNGTYNAEGNIKCLLTFGLSSNYFITDSLDLTLRYAFTDERNPLFKSNSDRSSKHRYNNNVAVGVMYNF